jgi:serine/threonine protein phosphatase 1
MILAIGDIHGCRVALETMIDYVAPTPTDTVVTLGDYVDRGPDSKGVVDFLLEFRKTHKLIHLKGNHELQMEDALTGRRGYEFWLEGIVGGRETLDSYGGNFAGIPRKHWDFLQSAGKLYECDTHFFVHAGVDPQVPLSEQKASVVHWKRFYQASPHPSGKIMVCGHTIQGDLPVNLGHSICLDTCAYGGGWLTALDVETGVYYQTNERGERRMGDIDGELR